MTCPYITARTIRELSLHLIASISLSVREDGWPQALQPGTLVPGTLYFTASGPICPLSTLPPASRSLVQVTVILSPLRRLPAGSPKTTW